jgi:hypothetical protein
MQITAKVKLKLLSQHQYCKFSREKSMLTLVKQFLVSVRKGRYKGTNISVHNMIPYKGNRNMYI